MPTSHASSRQLHTPYKRARRTNETVIKWAPDGGESRDTQARTYSLFSHKLAAEIFHLNDEGRVGLLAGGRQTLRQTQTQTEVVSRVMRIYPERGGGGWRQRREGRDWEVEKFPDKGYLQSLFPSVQKISTSSFIQRAEKTFSCI